MWKELFKKWKWNPDKPIPNEEQILDFIETEIISKLIDEMMNHLTENNKHWLIINKTTFAQLRKKWLGGKE